MLNACCGFKLRGSYTIPKYLKRVHLSPYEPYEELQRELITILDKHKVVIVCDSDAKVTTINLSRPTVSEDSLAIGPDSQVTRYKYTVSVTYSLSTTDASYSKVVVRSRELTRSNSQMLSNQSELQKVHKELIREIAMEIMRQITNKSPYSISYTSDTTADTNPC